MTRRACGRGVAALGIAGILAGTSPAGAVRLDDAAEISVSSDGVTWAADLATPLFESGDRWVPGDTRKGSFFVRNRGAQGATVRIEARDAGTRELTARGAVALFARTGGGRWHRLEMDTESAALNTAELPAGQVTQVDVRAVFEPGAGNETQAQSAALSFVVRLSDARVDHTGHDGDQSGDGLPATGAPDLAVPVLTGSVLVGMGLVLVRRRKETDHG
jgi:LPXTG-motif cell wall-anchored protein